MLPVGGGPDAGSKAGRYWAALIVAPLMLLLAFASSPVTGVLSAFPPSFMLAMVGLAILSSFQDALEKAFGGTLRFGAMVAFVVAATPFTVAGLPAACWALVAGTVASLVTEKDDLLHHWRSSGDPA